METHGDSVAHVVDSTCFQLALEGEKFMDCGKPREARRFFEAALTLGTDDLELLWLVYGKLWTIHYNLSNYESALEFAQHQCNLAKASADQDKEARAAGKCGNTLLQLERFHEAVSSFEDMLHLSEQLSKPALTNFALYYLGHTKYKWAKVLDSSCKNSTLARDQLQDALQYYTRFRDAMILVRDRPTEGKVCGSIGQVYYRLGRHEEALKAQTQCLRIAQEFGDIEVEQSSVSNLGNIYCSQSDYEQAFESFRRAFGLAQQLDDLSKQARALYSLANVASLLSDHEAAVQFCLQYLHLAETLHDQIGQCSMCCFLCFEYKTLQDYQSALYYASLYQDLSDKIGDSVGVDIANQLIEDVQNLQSDRKKKISSHEHHNDTISPTNGNEHGAMTPEMSSPPVNGKRESMKRLDLLNLSRDSGDNDDSCSSPHGTAAENSIGAFSSPPPPPLAPHDDSHLYTVTPDSRHTSGHVIDPPTPISPQSMNGSNRSSLTSVSVILSNSNSAIFSSNGRTIDSPSANSSNSLAPFKTPLRESRSWGESENTPGSSAPPVSPSLPGIYPIDGSPSSENEHAVNECVNQSRAQKSVNGVVNGIPDVRKKQSGPNGVVNTRKSSKSRRRRRSGLEFELSPSAGCEDCESLMELISRANESTRLDDQRFCMNRLSQSRSTSSLPVVNGEMSSVTEAVARRNDPLEYTLSPEQLIDKIARSQSHRMNDQRSALQLPGLFASPRNHAVIERARSQQHNFLDLLERCQGSRFDDQRTVLPPLPTSPTMPDDDFLNVISLLQFSGRMEEQRTELPPQAESRQRTASGNGFMSRLRRIGSSKSRSNGQAKR